MGFGIFKKWGRGRRKRDGELFDHTQDDLDFDELDTSGEFLNDNGGMSPPPGPAYSPPPTQSPPRPLAPPPRLSHPPPASPLPPAPRPRPAPPVYDDLTYVNLPPNSSLPGAPPQSAGRPGPAPPVPLKRSLPPSPPVKPNAGIPRVTPKLGDDDVTQVLSNPIGVESVVAWLVVASGTQLGRDYRLPGGTVHIGLDPRCEIFLDDDTYLSGRHAEISFRDGQYQIRDLNSTNGSFVNDARISEAVLRDNDRVRMGLTTFVFKSLTL